MKRLTLDRYKQSGQTRVEAGGFTFVVQRPTQAEVYASADRRIDIEFVARHVVGWEGVLESDLVPGGDPEPVEFDAAVLAAWLADRADLWAPLTDAVVTSFRAYEEAQEARGKP